VLLALFQYGSGWMPALWVTGEPGPSAGLSGAGHYPPPTPFGATVQVAGAALFLFAAALSRRLYRRDGMVGDRFLAVGLVFAAFAQVQPSDYPGTYTGLVTSDDLLRVAFGIVLLAGLQAQASAYLAHLRLANEAMSRSRETDAEHAALEERTRLARELHDGLAQDLWVAKLKSRRLTAQPNLDLETRALVDDLSEAIDAGLADAQQAVAAIRLPGEAAGTFSELMGQCVDEFADRFGLQAEFAIEEPLPQLTARAQAEALRIAREALSNASRHADATVVRVRAGVDAGRFVVTVGDNGRGFDPGAVGRSAFGLASMRERAALIGGELRIDSRPHDGTRISLIVPLAVAAVPVVVGAV
jgi:signal transduction histidine kinase